MSQYGIIYRLEFKNVEGYTIRVNISPTDVLIPDPDTPVVIALKGGDNPVVVSCSNDDEDKFSQIRSKSAKITFRSDSASGIDSATFSQGGDNLWACDIILQDTPSYIFRGFLMMADNQQPFQPDPQYVVLTATDHLASLKEIPLEDLSGDYPLGKYRVAALINFCLRKTGMSLSFYVVNNLRAGGARFTMSAVFAASGSTITITGGSDTTMFYVGQRIVITGTVSNNIDRFVTAKTSTVITVSGALVNETAAAAVFLDYNSQFHWYDVVYLDAKTFEHEIGIGEDCYTVLQKILGEDCFITQWLGSWWIFRVDEMEDNPVYAAQFNSSGVYVSTAAGTQYDKSIGALQSFKFANADTLLRFIRPHGFIKETFNFVNPLEVPCNIDFERGTLNATISPTQKRYNLDCWTIKQGIGSGSAAPLVTPYIERIFGANGYETKRYAVIPKPPDASTALHYIESESIPVLVEDRFTFSSDWAWSGNASSASAYNEAVACVRLEGGDGSNWTLDDDGVWYQSNASWTTNFKNLEENFVPNDVDETEFRSKSVTAKNVPVSGNVILMLYALNQNPASSVDDYDIYFNNIQFTYTPFINGSYQEYSGQYNQIDRTETGYTAKRDKEVFISDSPIPIIKGGMFLFNNSKYVLFPHWFAAAPNGNSYPPTVVYLHPYSYIQAYSVWNQYKGYNMTSPLRGIGINVFTGSVKNLTNSWPDILHRFSLTDTNNQTNSRYFILISMEQNWRTCVWSGTFIEVYNRVIYKTYTDILTFKFISR